MELDIIWFNLAQIIDNLKHEVVLRLGGGKHCHFHATILHVSGERKKKYTGRPPEGPTGHRTGPVFAEGASARHASGRASASTTAEDANARHTTGRGSPSTTGQDVSAGHVVGRTSPRTTGEGTGVRIVGRRRTSVPPR